MFSSHLLPLSDEQGEVTDAVDAAEKETCELPCWRRLCETLLDVVVVVRFNGIAESLEMKGCTMLHPSWFYACMSFVVFVLRYIVDDYSSF